MYILRLMAIIKINSYVSTRFIVRKKTKSQFITQINVTMPSTVFRFTLKNIFKLMFLKKKHINGTCNLKMSFEKKNMLKETLKE